MLDTNNLSNSSNDTRQDQSIKMRVTNHFPNFEKWPLECEFDLNSTSFANFCQFPANSVGDFISLEFRGVESVLALKDSGPLLEFGEIWISPIARHVLGILSIGDSIRVHFSPGKKNLANVLHIARVHRMPIKFVSSSSAEDASLHRYFSTARGISLGKILAVPLIDADLPSTMFADTTTNIMNRFGASKKGHIISNIGVLYYVVTSFIIDNASENCGNAQKKPNSYLNTQRRNSAREGRPFIMACNGETRLILDGSIVVDNFPDEIETEAIALLDLACLQRSIHKRLQSSPQSTEGVPHLLNPPFVSWRALVSDHYTYIPSPDRPYHNSTSNFLLTPTSPSEESSLVVSLLSVLTASPLSGTLLKEREKKGHLWSLRDQSVHPAVLVNWDVEKGGYWNTHPVFPLFPLISALHLTDVREALRSVAMKLGINFYTIEASFMLHYHSWSSQPSGSTAAAQAVVIADIEKFQPCILYLRDLDLACAQQVSASSIDDPQLALSQSLVSLQDMLHQLSQKRRGTVVPESILVGAVPRDVELKAVLRAAFPVSLDISDAELISRKPLDLNFPTTQSCGHDVWAERCLGGGLGYADCQSAGARVAVDLETQSMLLLRSALPKGASGSAGLNWSNFSQSPAVVRSLANESAAAAMERSLGSRWWSAQAGDCSDLMADFRQSSDFSCVERCLEMDCGDEADCPAGQGMPKTGLAGVEGSVVGDYPDVVLGRTDVLEGAVRLASGQLGLARRTGRGTAEVTPVKWEDIGGLERQRQEILDVLMLPRQHPDLFSKANRRRGILLFGPPGTGKTLVARAVATECGMSFMSIKGPELLDIYVGESERNVREVFQSARRSAPCVLFFDELDSLAPARGRGSDGGGVMDRVVSSLLSELDNLGGGEGTDTENHHEGHLYSTKTASHGEIFVIGATNRPDLLDPALLRPGRFDRLVYLGVTQNASIREQILKAQTRKFKLGNDVIFFEVAKRLNEPCTGADIGAVATAAFTRALERSIANLQHRVSTLQANFQLNFQGVGTEIAIADEEAVSDHTNSNYWEVSRYLESLPEDDPCLEVVVIQSDFLHAATLQKPSVTSKELVHYENIARSLGDYGV